MKMDVEIVVVSQSPKSAGRVLGVGVFAVFHTQSRMDGEKGAGMVEWYVLSLAAPNITIIVKRHLTPSSLDALGFLNELKPSTCDAFQASNARRIGEGDDAF